MASRRGTFGRAPRVAGNLTNTLVAIAREMQQQRDQNLVDAWKNGGMFEGKKATDEMVLAHWQERMKDVSQDDPMYDAYHNAYMQYDYAIHESKMSVLYAQEKISDAQMAQFYLGWAKKVPKNSEFWRVLQRDAAQKMQAAKGRSRANEAKLLEQAYNNAQDATYDKHEKAGDYLLGVLTTMVQKQPGIIGETGSLTDASEGDAGAILQVLSSIAAPQSGAAEGAEWAGSKAVLFHDPDNGDKPVTGQDIVDRYKKLAGGNFDGRITLATLQEAINNKKEGLKIRAKRAEKTGHYTHAQDLNKARNQLGEVGRQVNAWPVMADYMDAREDFFSVMNNPQSSFYNKDEAITKWQTYCLSLSNDPRITTDDRLKNQLKAEGMGDSTALTAFEDFTGASDPKAGSESTARLVNEQKLAQDGIKAVESQAAIWTTGEFEDDGRGFKVFVPGPGGSQVGPATNAQVAQASGGIKPRIIWAPDGGGVMRPVSVLGQDVRVSAVDRATNKSVPVDGDASPVATIYTLNGVQTAVYTGPNGTELSARLDVNPPWGDNARLVETDRGFELAITPPPPGAPLEGTGFAMKPTSTPGEMVLVIQPKAAVDATNPEHYTGGFDPFTEYGSPTLAFNSGTPEREKMLREAVSDPNAPLSQQVNVDLNTSAGRTLDPTTNLWSGGNDAEFNRMLAQSQGLVTTGSTSTEAWQKSIALQDRESIRKAGEPPAGSIAAKLGAANMPLQNAGLASFGAAPYDVPTTPLAPTDPALQASPLAGLLGVFSGKSLQLSQGLLGRAQQGTSITTIGNIKLPGVPNNPNIDAKDIAARDVNTGMSWLSTGSSPAPKSKPLKGTDTSYNSKKTGQVL